MKVASQTYPLGRGFAVEFRFDGLNLNVEWLPSVPPAVTGQELLPAYREARARFLEGLAPIYGNIRVVEL